MMDIASKILNYRKTVTSEASCHVMNCLWRGAQMANHWCLWSKPVGTRGWCATTWVNWEAEFLRQANNSHVSDVGSILPGAWSQLSSQPPPWLQPVRNLEPISGPGFLATEMVSSYYLLFILLTFGLFLTQQQISNTKPQLRREWE